MAYVKIIYQDSPSTATPINAENLNHMDDQIALNDQRLTEIETSYVKSFNGRTGAISPADNDYNIGQIAPLSGAQVGQVPVVVNHGTEQDPELVFEMGAGGGGGHSIIDSEGNTMPQESAMQFPDSFVSDDNVNGRTVVENVKEVASADYPSETEDGMYLIPDGEGAVIEPASDDYVEVTADGVKTYGQLLNELYTKIDITKLSAASCIYLLTDSGNTHIQQLRTKRSSNTIFEFLSPILESVGHLYVYSLTVQQSGSKYISVDISSSASHSDMSSTIPTSAKFTLYYGNKKATVDLQTTANRCWYDSNKTVKQKIDEKIGIGSNFAPSDILIIPAITMTFSSGSCTFDVTSYLPTGKRVSIPFASVISTGSVFLTGCSALSNTQIQVKTATSNGAFTGNADINLMIALLPTT